MLLGAGTGDLVRNESYYFTMRREGIDRARPTWIHNHFSSTPVDVIAAHFGFEGVRSCLMAACSSSTIAIGQAVDAIRRGRLDAALAGGTDALSRLTFAGFNALRLMDPQPCRPFDAGRQGMNIGEGAAILVLEDWDRADASRRAHLRGTGRLQLHLRGVSPDRTGAGRAGDRRRPFAPPSPMRQVDAAAR